MREVDRDSAALIQTRKVLSSKLISHFPSFAVKTAATARVHLVTVNPLFFLPNISLLIYMFVLQDLLNAIQVSMSTEITVFIDLLPFNSLFAKYVDTTI